MGERASTPLAAVSGAPYGPDAAASQPGGRRTGPTLRRRLLRLLPRLGVHVVDVGPGAALVTLRRGTRAQHITENLVVVSRRGKVHVQQLLGTEALVASTAASSKDQLRVVEVSPGTALVVAPRLARKHRLEQERGLYRHIVPNHLAQILAMYRVNCVLDVGANRGQYAQELRAAGYRGHIVSFEPVPGMFEQLERAAAQDEKWTVHQVALAERDGRTVMHVVPGTLSSVREPTEFGARRYAKLRDTTEVEVPMRRLDGLLDEVTGHIADRRGYLKLDTQGYDLEVFEGLGARAKELVGMQSEVALMTIYAGMPRLPQALEVYEAAGFEVTGFYPVSRESRTARVLEFDCVMVRAEAR